MKEKLKRMLKPDRYAHSLGVCDTAVKLAKKYGADEKKAYTAGLLHDAAKSLSYDEMIEKCGELGIVLDHIELRNPVLIHAVMGGAYVEAEFGIVDEQIKHAIKYHTTGKERMSLLEKIIYIADMIEPNRAFDGVENLRRLADTDIDQACIAGLTNTMIFNLKKGMLIHPNSLSALNDLLINEK